jgi:hypothetical protein
MARRELIDAFAPERVQADLILGRVFGPSGKMMMDWVTVRGRQRLIIRGSTNVSYRRCDLCRRHVYFAMGKRYLFPAPDADFLISESDLYGLVVDPTVPLDLDLGRWSSLGRELLKVLPKPMDSLGELK